MSKKKKTRIRIEIFIIIAIMICKCFIMNYNSVKRMHGFLSLYDDGSVVVLHNNERVKEFKENGRPIIEYYPDSCRMIEVFDPDFNLVGRMVFLDVSNYYKGIHNHPEMKAEFLSKDEGTVTISTDEIINIYYKWTDLPSGERYLMVYSYSDDAEKELLYFNIACYISIFLTLMLFIILLIREYQSIINRYDSLSREIRSKMIQ